MYEQAKPLQLSTVFANVPDIDAVLSELFTRLGLRPYLRFEVDTPEGVTPLALIKIGAYDLELLGRTAGTRPNSGVIQSVELEIPIAEAVEIEPAPGMNLVCYPGTCPRLRALDIHTDLPQEDTATFIENAGAVKHDPASPLMLDTITLRLHAVEGLPAETPPDLYFPGWHRLGVHVPAVTEAYDAMAASGSSLRGLVEPFQVMSGLKEAMLASPSGLIWQLTEESLLKMTPSLALEWVHSKFSGHRMRFKPKNV